MAVRRRVREEPRAIVTRAARARLFLRAERARAFARQGTRDEAQRFDIGRRTRARSRARALARSATAAAAPGDSIKAGELVVEPPTLISLGFEWTVEGDANRNAAAAVAYRRKGETQWRTGLPLLRLQNERTAYANTLDYTAPNMFAGSLFDLAENTEYEVRLTLTRPRRRGGRGRPHRDGAHARGAAAVRRRPHVPRLSVRLQGRASRSRHSSGCSRRTTRTRSAATGAARRRRASSPATRCSCTPASTRTSTATTTATRSSRGARRAAARRGTARTSSRRAARRSGRSRSRRRATARWCSTATATTCCST